MTLVSVIMPAYREEAHLADAVGSVVAQTYPDWELIIVDDCSPDGTFELAKRLAEGDDRIQAYQLPENSGRPAVPRIFAIERSKGDFIAFLDGDDIWFDDKLKIQLSAFTGDSIVAVCSPAETILDDVRTGQLSTAAEIDLDSTIEENTIVNSSVIVRRSAYFACGGLDPSPVIRFGEDWDLWLRLLSTGKIVRTKEPAVGYRMHSGNLGRSEDQYEMVTRIIEKNAALPGLSTAAHARSRAKFEYKYGIKMVEDDPARARKHLKTALSARALPPRLVLRCILLYLASLVPIKGARRAIVSARTSPRRDRIGPEILGQAGRKRPKG